MNTTTPRTRAIAAQDQSIQSNIAKIEEQRQRPTAIQAMAVRLNMTPGKLQDTLRQTVFRDANDAEFAALIVVANEYRLNPLLKEIFAFKAKGGGIIPYVSVDGWIRIINEHPQYDGIEFNDIVDETGDLYAIECVIWRKDRTKPTKVVEYLEECRRDSEPWKKSPKRFLRHRSLMQCGRVAFGFSGIVSDEDYEIVGYARTDEPVTLPTRREVAHDVETGEIIDEELTEEAARELDRQSYAMMEGRADTDMGEMTALETAMAQLDDAPNIMTVNSRVAVLKKDLSAEDGAALQSYAVGLIAEMKGAA